MRLILPILKGQISRFWPNLFPGSGTEIGTGIPGSDSGTGRTIQNVKLHISSQINYEILVTIFWYFIVRKPKERNDYCQARAQMI